MATVRGPPFLQVRCDGANETNVDSLIYIIRFGGHNIDKLEMIEGYDGNDRGSKFQLNNYDSLATCRAAGKAFNMCTFNGMPIVATQLYQDPSFRIKTTAKTKKLVEGGKKRRCNC